MPLHILLFFLLAQACSPVMMTTSFGEMAGDRTCQTIDNIVNNFVPQHHDTSLSPLRLANISISEFSTELSNYLSVLNEGGSIAFCRGEDLTSKSLSKNLESLFSITTPSVREGPPLTWTRLVLFAGPQFEGPAQLQVENSSVELSAIDLKLLRSGRPWRFLFPWPDKDDCKKELQSNDTVLQELVDARKTIGEVVELISLVARRLRNHRDLISRLSEDKHHANHRGGALPFEDTQSSVPNEDVFGPVASAEHESSGHRDSQSSITILRYRSNDQTSHPTIEEPHGPGLSGSALAEKDLQCDGPRSNEGAIQGVRLHTSDFIQSLSE
ncbi:hypothetical protein PENNAL_c0205G02379 [Penicillium nalgiovense]|nr:hypothetical protein PENNAL_c0205G02379 [Penicillium nalgiovense]